MTCSEAGAARWKLVAAVLLGLAGGCVRPPLLVPVKGIVLLDGKPLPSGVVQFQPSAGQPASGQIGPDGSFTLSRHAPNDGVPPGTYRVAVIAYDPRAEVQAVENLIVPVKYTRFGSSGIEFTVFPGTVDPLVVSLSSDTEPEQPPAADDGNAAGVSVSRPSEISHAPQGDERGTPVAVLGGT